MWKVLWKNWQHIVRMYTYICICKQDERKDVVKRSNECWIFLYVIVCTYEWGESAYEYITAKGEGRVLDFKMRFANAVKCECMLRSADISDGLEGKEFSICVHTSRMYWCELKDECERIMTNLQTKRYFHNSFIT